MKTREVLIKMIKKKHFKIILIISILILLIGILINRSSLGYIKPDQLFFCSQSLQMGISMELLQEHSYFLNQDTIRIFPCKMIYDKERKDNPNSRALEGMIKARNKLPTIDDLNSALARQAAEEINPNVEKIFTTESGWALIQKTVQDGDKNKIDILKNQFDLQKQQYELEMEKQKEDVVTRNIRLEANGFAAAITTPVMRTGANSYMGGGIFDKNQNISEQTPINVTINGDINSAKAWEDMKKDIVTWGAGQVGTSTRAVSNGG